MVEEEGVYRKKGCRGRRDVHGIGCRGRVVSTLQCVPYLQQQITLKLFTCLYQPFYSSLFFDYTSFLEPGDKRRHI